MWWPIDLYIDNEQMRSTNTHNTWLRWVADFIPRDPTGTATKMMPMTAHHSVTKMIQINNFMALCTCDRPDTVVDENAVKSPQHWTKNEEKTTLLTIQPLVNLKQWKLIRWTIIIVLNDNSPNGRFAVDKKWRNWQ
jgi:hypothetical protein